ncbi:MAG: RNA 2',3'-cyclic phosphodiesterase, partial [Nanoarchaeota archaeon]
MRLFIAIEPNQRVKDYLCELQRKISTQGSNLSFSSGFHITLKFLGDVSEDRLILLKKNLNNIEFSPFKIRTSGVGFFKKKHQVSVVWAGVEPKEEI